MNIHIRNIEIVQSRLNSVSLQIDPNFCFMRYGSTYLGFDFLGNFKSYDFLTKNKTEISFFGMWISSVLNDEFNIIQYKDSTGFSTKCPEGGFMFMSQTERGIKTLHVSDSTRRVIFRHKL